MYRAACCYLSPWPLPAYVPDTVVLAGHDQVFFFSRDTLEVVKRVELPGLPSSYHIVNACQEEESGNVSVVIVKLREGGREKLETTFKNMMTHR